MLNSEARTYRKTDSSNERFRFVCPENISDLFCHVWQHEILPRLCQYALKILTDLSEESALGQLVYILISFELSLNETRRIKRKQLMRAAAFNLHHALRFLPWLRNYSRQCQLFTFWSQRWRGALAVRTLRAYFIRKKFWRHVCRWCNSCSIL